MSEEKQKEKSSSLRRKGEGTVSADGTEVGALPPSWLDDLTLPQFPELSCDILTKPLPLPHRGTAKKG